MNGYLAFFRGKCIEVIASSSYEAQQKAARKFRAKNTYEVSVFLAEKENSPVVHVPDF